MLEKFIFEIQKIIEAFGKLEEYEISFLLFLLMIFPGAILWAIIESKIDFRNLLKIIVSKIGITKELREHINEIEIPFSSEEDRLGFSERLNWSHLYSSRGTGGYVKKFGLEISSLRQGQIDSVDIAIIDIVTGSGEDESNLMAAHFNSELLNLPPFYLRPAWFWRKAGVMLGDQKNISFNEYPNFSRKYILTGDEMKVRNLFRSKANILRYLENHEGWSVEGYRTQLLVYQEGIQIIPTDDQMFLHQAHRIFKIFS